MRPSDPPLPAARGLLLRAAGTLGRRPRPGTAIGSEDAWTAWLDPAWLARYRAYFGFGGAADAVPPTALYPLAQRAALAALVRPGFPFPVVGAVHLANGLRRRGAIDPAAGLALAVTVAEAAFPDAPGWVGADVAVDFAQGGAIVATCRSTYLLRKAGRRAARPEAPAAGDLVRARWALPADEGRRYAALSGDWNPIHLAPLLARPFGFRRPILHGMDGVARAAAAIEGAAGRAVAAIAVEFGRPLLLPGAADFAAGADGTFAWTSGGGNVHAAGRFELG